MHHLIHAAVALAAFLVLFLILIVAICVYFIPTGVAFLRRCEHRKLIGVLNLVFGWSFVGWVICLVWAVAGARENEKRKQDNFFD